MNSINGWEGEIFPYLIAFFRQNYGNISIPETKGTFFSTTLKVQESTIPSFVLCWGYMADIFLFSQFWIIKLLKLEKLEKLNYRHFLFSINPTSLRGFWLHGAWMGEFRDYFYSRPYLHIVGAQMQNNRTLAVKLWIGKSILVLH